MVVEGRNVGTLWEGVRGLRGLRGWVGGLNRDDGVDTRGYVPGQCECDRSSSTLKTAH